MMGTQVDASTIDPMIAAQLSASFQRNGYVRRQDAGRVAELGWKRYKKGDEIRLVARDTMELELLRELLVTAGFKPGRAYSQARRWRQPIYGRAQVAAFLEMVAAVEAGI